MSKNQVKNILQIFWSFFNIKVDKLINKIILLKSRKVVWSVESDKKKIINRNFAAFLTIGIVLTLLGIGFLGFAISHVNSLIIPIYDYLYYSFMISGIILVVIGIGFIVASIIYRCVKLGASESKEQKVEDSPLEALRKLKTLYNQKAITKKEYDEQKQKVLERM